MSGDGAGIRTADKVRTHGHTLLFYMYRYPIVFGNNLITSSDGKRDGEAIHSIVYITSLRSVVAQFESGGTKSTNFFGDRKCEIITNFRTTNTWSVNLDKGKCDLIANLAR